MRQDEKKRIKEDNMQEASIYIATTAKGPAKRKKAFYTYKLEGVNRNGKIKVKDESGYVENTTENQLELKVLTEAFNRFTESCSIRVFTCCEHVLNSINNGWVWQWEKNNWVNAGNRPVKNAELWKKLLEAMKIHTVAFIGTENNKIKCMDAELERMKENEHVKEHNAR